MEFNANDKIRRFCYLGRFEPVYEHLVGTINVNTYLPKLEALYKSLNDVAILLILNKVLQENTLVRRDEPLFVYASYLASDVDINWKTSLRKDFPSLILNDEDLFLFCKYASLIQRAKNHKGFSNTVRKAIKSWYEGKMPDELREMWLWHRGAHGFTHKVLIKLCHVNDDAIGAEGVVTPFFKSCTELLKASEESEDAAVSDEAVGSIVSENAHITSSAILSVSKLRTTNNMEEAKRIIRQLKLRVNQVPIHLLKFGDIMEVLIPTMTVKELLQSWRYLERYNHFSDTKIIELCRAVLANKRQLRKDNIHPIVILMHMRDLGMRDDIPELSPKRVVKLKILKELYLQSFGNNESTGLRMHITINIQKNYRKKTLKNHKKLHFLEAAIALAFGYFEREKEVNVFYWAEKMHKLGQMPWNFKNITVDYALKYCDLLDIKSTPQRLITPIMSAMDAEQVYDIFLVIVANAGRGNPKNSSEYLTTFMDRYREMRNERAKYVILDLLKFRKSMNYSDTRKENILEICGLDPHTTNLINNFGLNRFG